MESFPILDYTPPTLLGIVILLILFGKLVPVSAMKPYKEQIDYQREQNDYLRSALTTSQQSEAETVKALTEEQKTTEIVRRVFGDLERRADL